MISVWGRSKNAIPEKLTLALLKVNFVRNLGTSYLRFWNFSSHKNKLRRKIPE